MEKENVIPFDIKKKYMTYADLSKEDYYEIDGFSAPLFDSIYVDKYKNTIGITKSGKQVLIPKK